MPIELSPDWWQKFPENTTLQYLDLLGRGRRVKILLLVCFCSQKAFAPYPVLVGLHHMERLQSKGHGDPHLLPIHVELSPTAA